MTHPHADYLAAMSPTWNDAVAEMADELPRIVRALAKLHIPSTAAEHEDEIVQHFEDNAAEFLIAVAAKYRSDKIAAHTEQLFAGMRRRNDERAQTEEKGNE